MMNSHDAHLPESPSNGARLHPTVLDVGTQGLAKVYAEAILRAAQTRSEGQSTVANNPESMPMQFVRVSS